MKSFPFYHQHDAMDCGPACLRMIASAYGRAFSLEHLRELSSLSHEGVSLLGISEAAERIGFRTTGVLLSMDELHEAPLPCIVHWNRQHFVVVYAITGSGRSTTIRVADPAAGKLNYTPDEFKACWISGVDNGTEVGVGLLLEPTPAFYQEHDDDEPARGSIRFLASYLRPYHRLMLQLLAGTLLGSLLQLLLPFLMQSIVDLGIAANNTGYVWLVLAAQMMLVVSQSLLGFIRGWILLHIGARVNIALVSGFLLKLMRLPMGYFDSKMTGDLLQRIHDHTRIQNYLTNSGLNILFSFFSILILSVVLLLYSRLVFALFLFGSVLYAGWVWLFMKQRALLDGKTFAQQSANQSTVIQLIQGMQEIKLNGCEQQKRWDWERIQAVLFRLRVKGLVLSQYQESGAVLINQSKNILITALVAQLVIKGEMTLGMMLSVQYILGQLGSPVDQMIGFARETQDARLSLERLREVQQLRSEEPEREERMNEIPEKALICMQDVSFRYEDTAVSPMVLKNINMSIIPGKQTAIVGTSGSGKTTLLKLLLGFYAPSQGRINVNDVELTAYSMREWRKQCGVVMQDGFLFSDTIARNIAPGAERIDKKRLLQAVLTANCRDFIESLPLGYSTKIGNDGHGLSQGQKQRILIARAVYKNPQFVLLDEATNALDTTNEKVIMENLQHFLAGRTSVVVAHRLSTVRNADNIVVLDKGTIVETGTHEQLIAAQGAYYHLVKNQLDV